MYSRTLVSIAAMSAFVVLAFGSSGASSDLSGSVSMPSSLSKDQPATIEVELSNAGEAALDVSTLEIPSDLARSWEITSSSPAITNEAPTGMSGDIEMTFATPVTVAAGGTAKVSLDVVPRLGGRKSGSLKFRTADSTSAWVSVTSSVPGDDEEPLSWTVSAPSSAAVGETIELTVQLVNQGTRPDELIDVGLNEELYDHFDVVSIDPPPQVDEESALGGRSYTYNETLLPGSQTDVVFTLTATSGGTLDDYVNLCFESELLCKQPGFEIRVQ